MMPDRNLNLHKWMKSTRIGALCVNMRISLFVSMSLRDNWLYKVKIITMYGGVYSICRSKCMPRLGKRLTGEKWKNTVGVLYLTLLRSSGYADCFLFCTTGPSTLTRWAHIHQALKLPSLLKCEHDETGGSAVNSGLIFFFSSYWIRNSFRNHFPGLHCSNSTLLAATHSLPWLMSTPGLFQLSAPSHHPRSFRWPWPQRRVALYPGEKAPASSRDHDHSQPSPETLARVPWTRVCSGPVPWTRVPCGKGALDPCVVKRWSAPEWGTDPGVLFLTEVGDSKGRVGCLACRWSSHPIDLTIQTTQQPPAGEESLEIFPAYSHSLICTLSSPQFLSFGVLCPLHWTLDSESWLSACLGLSGLGFALVSLVYSGNNCPQDVLNAPHRLGAPPLVSFPSSWLNPCSSLRRGPGGSPCWHFIKIMLIGILSLWTSLHQSSFTWMRN